LCAFLRAGRGELFCLIGVSLRFVEGNDMRQLLRQTLIAAALITGLAASGPVAQAVTNIDGTYADPGGYVHITLRQCETNVRCGVITRIVRAKPGEPDNDAHNANPALRARPILGLTILSNLRWSGGAWRGQVYNPEDGGTYRAIVRPGSGGALSVQGCLAFFCRTQSWPAAR